MVREISRSYFLLLAVPIFFVTVAVISSQKALLMPAVYSVIMVGLILYLDTDLKATVKFSLDKERVYVGDTVKGKASLEIGGPPGMVTVVIPPASYLERDDAPKYRQSFEVVKGKASRLYFKGFQTLDKSFDVEVKVLKRGIYDFGKVNYAHQGLLGASVNESKWDAQVQLTALPRYKVASRTSWRLRPSSANPRVTRNRLGPFSTDFLSVREYATGDPFKFINWKATARSPNGQIMVNEFEREGLRNVVFLYDVGRWMRYGLSQENPLERGVPLVLSLSKALLDHGYNVGLWTAPPTGVSVMPSSGQTQFHKILKAMLELSYWEEKGIKIEELLILRRVISETNALLVVVSNLAGREVLRSLNETMTVRGKALTRTILIDVIHTSIVMRRELEAEFPGMKLIAVAPDRKKTYSMLPRGIMVIPWDPEAQGIGEVMEKVMSIVGWMK